MNDGSAQTAGVRGRSCERVMSTPLLPFPIRPGTGRQRHKRPITEKLRTRQCGPKSYDYVLVSQGHKRTAGYDNVRNGQGIRWLDSGKL